VGPTTKREASSRPSVRLACARLERIPRLVSAVFLCVLVAAGPAGAAGAPAGLPAAGAAKARGAPAAGPCTSSGRAPTCGYAYGRVTFVADGDTVDVRIRGLGVRRIRLTGINAMEQTRYSKYPRRRRGACHALAATARLHQLIRAGHRRVRLAAQSPASVAGTRLRRQLSVRIGGRWIDTGAALVAEGHALWLPNGVEYAWNRTYSHLSQLAAAHRLRLFDPDGCGRGPGGAAQPRLRLRWDARGNDGINVNGEYARVRNPGPRPLRLGRWWFRDSSARRFVFPRGTVVAPRRSVTLRVGRGRATKRRLHWGLPKPAFENASGGRRAMGDGGYLFDPRGNLRAFVIYPRRA
jgi:micrococcal nuclease